ncbi:hypothetical protein LWC35_26215 [Pseudonocardia kujensis]|uniref:hypothetical protein n=1 Tax=Pseudonocardia kujensis TaxID=1128675 RepID=UPI001E32B0F8|nr:hypothetical protein [Pseudonocardia kujensis]MCE0766371.1 hypothetical protein [Pseudonocardia kujensis]
MKTSKFAGAGAAAVGAATAAAVLLLGSTAASAEPVVDSSAYVFRTDGLLSISPSPYAESRDGDHDRQSVADVTALPLHGKPGIGLSALVAEAEGHRAEATVAKVNLLDVLKAETFRTWCDGADGGSAGVDLVNASILGTPVKAPAEEQRFDVSPLLQVTLNQQDRDDDSITVTGFTLTLLPNRDDPKRPLNKEEQEVAPDLVGLVTGQLPDLQKTPLRTVDDLLRALSPKGDLLKITVGSATCALEEEKEHEAEPVVKKHEPEPGEAPRPEVVQKSLPVTG